MILSRQGENGSSLCLVLKQKREEMRKLLLGILLAPLACHAALVIQGDDPAAARSAAAPARPAIDPASIAPVAAIPAQAASSASVPSIPKLDIKPVWRVQPSDSTFQKLFSRWAGSAGWTLVWDVPQDIPVIGQYTFEGSFTDAVFSVTDSTDGTDMPIHPCFYTNNLVRIVPVSVVCNPDSN